MTVPGGRVADRPQRGDFEGDRGFSHGVQELWNTARPLRAADRQPPWKSA